MLQEMTKGAAEEILELPHRYTREDVRRAYTNLARLYHPDAAARHRYNPEAAQAKMVEANKANDVLRQLFADDPNRAIERERDGIGGGFAEVDWRAGAQEQRANADAWDFVSEWVGAPEWVSAPMPKQEPVTVRSLLLGPVVPRVLCVTALVVLWTRTFPLLPHNLSSYLPQGAWTLMDVARLVAAIIYPTYLVVYEALSGILSGLVRELANGAVSWVTRRYVDLRPKTSSYGCALYKLLRNQVYAVLMIPLVLYVAACAAHEAGMMQLALWILTLVMGIDTLAACVRGGFVNTWSASIADRVEERYLLVRAQLLKRCGAWEG